MGGVEDHQPLDPLGVVHGQQPGQPAAPVVPGDGGRAGAHGPDQAPVSWPPTTSSTCPATARVRAAGRAPAPPASGWQANHHRRGSSGCSRAATPRHRGAARPPHGKGAVPAFDVVLRPTKSVSVLYGLGDAATGRAVLAAHHAGLAEAVAYLDQHLGARRGHGGVQHVSGHGLLAVGFDHRTSREGDRWCTPTW
jgi:hypothetical protein